jgi:uncharacterized protein YkwD
MNWRKFATWFLFAGFAVVLLTYSIANNTCEQEDLAREQRIFEQANQARIENGLTPLERDNFMDELAREHCQYLRKQGIYADFDEVAHDGFEERREKIIDMLGASLVGENVGRKCYSASVAVDGWLNSPMHKYILLDPVFTRTGVGYVDGYVCQIFSD